MGAIIVLRTNSFSIDLQGLSSERDYAKIKYSCVRSLVKSTDDTTVQIIFTSGEIYGFPWQAIATVNGVAVTSQDDLFEKLEPKLCPD